MLLKNTLLVPGLAKGLVSLSRLTEKGCNIMCISNYSYTDCEVCMKAKATRSSFKEKRVKEYISPGESLAMDLGFIDGRP